MDNHIQRLWNYLGLGIIAVIVAVILKILVSSIFADSKVKYCIIESEERVLYVLNRPEDKTKNAFLCKDRLVYEVYYKLTGFVDWRSNQLIGLYSNLDSAIESANKINCPLSTIK